MILLKTVVCEPSQAQQSIYKPASPTQPLKSTQTGAPSDSRHALQGTFSLLLLIFTFQVAFDAYFQCIFYPKERQWTRKLM